MEMKSIARATYPDLATLSETLIPLLAPARAAGFSLHYEEGEQVLKILQGSFLNVDMVAVAAAVAAAPARGTVVNTDWFRTKSRNKDVLATCALVVRARGITAWNNMSIQQKKDAALAEADVWVTIRDFIEANL